MRISDWSSDVCSSDLQAFAPVDAAQIVGQPPQLHPIGNVAREQDIARRVGLAEKGALVRGQFKPGNAENGRRHGRENRSNKQYRQVGAASARGKSWRCNRLEEHTSELQSLMRISYAVFC